jgi:tetratricopeptide (TPR) repeat protein/transglutaminase-like putative cysteine protease
MIALLTTSAAPAWAGEQPLYQPVPDWVVPTPQEAAAASTAGQPLLRIFDEQKRISHGQVWTYITTATRIDTPEGLQRVGTSTLKWAPEHGDLIIHGVTILRGDKRIDVLAGGKRYTVLRREEKLESLQLDGTLTATLSLEGLQVGDIVETRVSVTDKDAALQGHISTGAQLLAQPVQLGFGRVRVLWSDGDAIRWKAYLEGVTPTETTRPGWHEWQVTLPVVRQPDLPAQAPGRFNRLNAAQFSDFSGWGEVSKVMAPLYRIDAPTAAITPGGDLDQEVARIAAASSDPRRRTALALQLVQDKVRYFAVGMNGGNLVPQPPEKTWAMRYGDCKAKTLLLLAVLHKLGIEAEPAMASLSNGDRVQSSLPSMAAFDHVMVLAHVGGKVLWLDGTGLGTREADLDDVPNYGWVLPVRANGSADLLQAPLHPPARPNAEVHYDVDLRAGVGLLAPFHVTLALRGGGIGQINTMLGNLDAEGKAKVLGLVLGNASAGGRRIFVKPQLAYDPQTGEGTITADGVVFSDWTRADSRYSFDPKLVQASTYPDRSRAIWQTIPVALGAPQHGITQESFQLPRGGQGIFMQGEGDQQRSLPLGGSSRVRAELKDGVWRLTLENLRSGGEMPAADIPAMRRADADFIARMPRLRTDAGYPAPWQNIEAAKRDHLFDATLANLGAWISEKPDDAERYRLRASFLGEIFERQKAIADLDKALELKGDKQLYLLRATLYELLGDKVHSVADLKAAYDLDPADLAVLSRLSFVQAWAGGSDQALDRLNGLLTNGGEKEPFYHARKAEVLARRGDTPGAIVEIDAALARRSGNAGLLGDRCWLKGLLNTDLDNALADCNRSIQIGGNSTAPALGSRGLVQLRQHHTREAIADLTQALDLRPAHAADYLLRALAEREAGENEAARRDLAAARLLHPAIEQFYSGFGLRW